MTSAPAAIGRHAAISGSHPARECRSRLDARLLDVNM
jgi:hypothetical protein